MTEQGGAISSSALDRLATDGWIAGFRNTESSPPPGGGKDDYMCGGRKEEPPRPFLTAASLSPSSKRGRPVSELGHRRLNFADTLRCGDHLRSVAKSVV